MSLCLTITSYHKITPGQCAEKSMNQSAAARIMTGYCLPLGVWFPRNIV